MLQMKSFKVKKLQILLVNRFLCFQNHMKTSFDQDHFNDVMIPPQKKILQSPNILKYKFHVIMKISLNIYMYSYTFLCHRLCCIYYLHLDNYLAPCTFCIHVKHINRSRSFIFISKIFMKYNTFPKSSNFFNEFIEI